MTKIFRHCTISVGLAPLANYIRVISIFLNHPECSLSNVCYILYKNNINKNEKTFKNEQRSRDAAAKKELIQVEWGNY